jgi:hypothetical protein
MQNKNGLLFSTSEELSLQFTVRNSSKNNDSYILLANRHLSKTLFKGFQNGTATLAKLRDETAAFQRIRWSASWNENAKPLFQ